MSYALSCCKDSKNLLCETSNAHCRTVGVERPPLKLAWAHRSTHLDNGPSCTDNMPHLFQISFSIGVCVCLLTISCDQHGPDRPSRSFVEKTWRCNYMSSMSASCHPSSGLHLDEDKSRISCCFPGLLCVGNGSWHNAQPCMTIILAWTCCSAQLQ